MTHRLADELNKITGEIRESEHFSQSLLIKCGKAYEKSGPTLRKDIADSVNRWLDACHLSSIVGERRSYWRLKAAARREAIEGLYG